MKKLMFAAAAIAAGVAVADVMSANVVGYQNKSLRENLNYLAPTFIKVNGTKTINLQDIQMDTSVEFEAAEIMVKNASEINVEDYYWYPKRTDPTKADYGKAGPESGYRWTVPEGKNGLWVEWVYDSETGEELEDYAYRTDREFDYGEAVVMQSGSEEYTVGFAGSVTDDNLVYPLRENLNYVANPFPAPVNLQDFQMDATVEFEAAEIMVKNASEINTEDYYWYPKRTDPTKADYGKAGPESGYRWTVPEGKNGLWIEWVYDSETGEELEDYAYVTDREFEPGEAVVLQSGSDEYTVTILAPFDL